MANRHPMGLGTGLTAMSVPANSGLNYLMSHGVSGLALRAPAANMAAVANGCIVGGGFELVGPTWLEIELGSDNLEVDIDSSSNIMELSDPSQANLIKIDIQVGDYLDVEGQLFGVAEKLGVSQLRICGTYVGTPITTGEVTVYRSTNGASQADKFTWLTHAEALTHGLPLLGADSTITGDAFLRATAGIYGVGLAHAQVSSKGIFVGANFV